MLATAAIGTASLAMASADEVNVSAAEGGRTAVPLGTERQVLLVQRVAPQTVLRPLRDRSSRISEKGTDLWKISASGDFDVPSAALAAYKNAAADLARTQPGCQIPWTLLAGIGRVESDHGRYGGSQLGSDGLPRPAIIGIALDGHGPVAAIHDTDHGRWDGDKVWDRAVGPMQFIPSTWRYAGRDGDGNGVANPNDIDDAALATADYLCPSSGSILSPDAMRAAIYSYNHSDYYVALVMAFERGYRTGVFEIPSPPPPPSPSPHHKHHHKKHHAEHQQADHHAPSQQHHPSHPSGSSGGSGGSHNGSSGGSSGGTHSGSHGGTGGGAGGGSHGGSGGGSGGGSHTGPTPSPTPTPTPTETPTEAPTATSTPTP